MRVAAKCMLSGSPALAFNYMRYLRHSYTSSKDQHALKKKKENLLGYEIVFNSYPEFIELFEEIFIDKVYHFTCSSQSPMIIDAGSNIGLSVLYFKHCYPASKIIAFEAEASNLALLQENITTNALSDIILVRGALTYGRDGSVVIATQDSGLQWSMKRTDAAHHQHTTALLLSDYVDETVDLLKLDIEGSETDVLNDLIETGKIRLIRNIVCEFHQNPSGWSLRELLETLTRHGFTCKEQKRKSGSEDVVIWFVRDVC
jgi:FkbM family methyltransferase